MTLQLLPIYCFNSSVGLFIVSTAMFSDIKWHCNDFICKWNVYTCEDYIFSICWWTILKMYSPRSPPVWHHSWMNRKNIFFIFLRICDVTLLPAPPPPPPPPKKNDVTNCHNFVTHSPPSPPPEACRHFCNFALLICPFNVIYDAGKSWWHCFCIKIHSAVHQRF